MPIASGSQAAWRAAASSGRSLASSETPLAPLASANTQSLVEHSPSTVMALNVSSTAASKRALQTVRARHRASVVRNPSIVAIIGSIMPEPLAMPPTRNVPFGADDLDRRLLRERIGRHDRRARRPLRLYADRAPAAICDPALDLAHVELHADHAGRRHEHRGRRRQPSAAAVRSAIALACAIPSAPVHALAQPLLTTIAAARPPERGEPVSRDEDRRGLREVGREDRGGADRRVRRRRCARSRRAGRLDAARHAGRTEAARGGDAAVDRAAPRWCSRRDGLRAPPRQVRSRARERWRAAGARCSGGAAAMLRLP